MVSLDKFVEVAYLILSLCYVVNCVCSLVNRVLWISRCDNDIVCYYFSH